MARPETLHYASNKAAPSASSILGIVFLIALLVMLPALAIFLFALRDAELGAGGGLLFTSPVRAGLWLASFALLAIWLALVAWVGWRYGRRS